MKYDFNSAPERRGTGSYKWDSAADPEVLPLWVADMDLRTAPAIIEALRRRVDHGIFGYTLVGKDYYDAVTGWFNRRHGWNIDSEWIIYTSGVVPAISAIIKALTKPGDKVLVHRCFDGAGEQLKLAIGMLRIGISDQRSNDHVFETHSRSDLRGSNRSTCHSLLPPILKDCR